MVLQGKVYVKGLEQPAAGNKSTLTRYLSLVYHLFLMKKSFMSASSVTYHSGFSNGAKAVDEDITGNVDRRTFTQREGEWFQHMVKIQMMTCIFQDAWTSCSTTSGLVSLKLVWSTLCPPANQTSLVQPREMHSTFTYECGAIKQAPTTVDMFLLQTAQHPILVFRLKPAPAALSPTFFSALLLLTSSSRFPF